MTTVATSICLMKYFAIPSEIANMVAEYIGATRRWLPHFDIHGHLRWKLNLASFEALSQICSYKPLIVTHFRSEQLSVVLNGSHTYTESDTVMIAPKLLSPTEIELTLYTSIEIESNVFHYAIVNSKWSFHTTSTENQFIKGVLIRPNEPIQWNRQQNITLANIQNNTYHIGHTEVIMLYVWNPYLNIGEYIVHDLHEPIPEWDPVDETDNDWE